MNAASECLEFKTVHWPHALTGMNHAQKAFDSLDYQQIWFHKQATAMPQCLFRYIIAVFLYIRK